MLEDLLAVKDLVAFIQEEERGDAVDLRGEEDFFAVFHQNVPYSCPRFHPLVNTKKMDIILET
jgi:hypothetical protein